MNLMKVLEKREEFAARGKKSEGKWERDTGVMKGG